MDVSQERLVCSIMLGLAKPVPQGTTDGSSNSSSSPGGFGFSPASLGQLISSAAGIRSSEQGRAFDGVGSTKDGTGAAGQGVVSVGSLLRSQEVLTSQDEWSELDKAAADALAAATDSIWVSAHNVRFRTVCTFSAGVWVSMA